MSTSIPGPADARADLPPQAAPEDRSIGEMFSKVTSDLSTLMQQELELAKAELKQTATRAGAGVGMFVGAAVGALLMLAFLSTAAWWALGHYTGRGWSALIVAGIWAVIAAVLFVVGRSQLGKARGIPKTTQTLTEIPEALAGNEGAS